MKKNKGITLVALVVTIVVLLILAGVSINLVLGDNGIIAKAKEAQRKSAEASQNDLIGMNELAQQLGEKINGSTGSGSGNGGTGGKTEPETVPYLPSDDFHYDTSTSVLRSLPQCRCRQCGRPAFWPLKSAVKEPAAPAQCTNPQKTYNIPRWFPVLE